MKKLDRFVSAKLPDNHMIRLIGGTQDTTFTGTGTSTSSGQDRIKDDRHTTEWWWTNATTGTVTQGPDTTNDGGLWN